MILLGIETSCDETSAAVVSGGDRAAPSILSNVVLFCSRNNAVVIRIYGCRKWSKSKTNLYNT